MRGRRVGRWQPGKSRRCRKRPLRERILIVCEGLTERNYFDQMKGEGWVREHLAVVVKHAKGGARERIAEFAVERKNDADEPYDEAWCVMDV